MTEQKGESDELARDVGEATIEHSLQGGLEILAKFEGVTELAEATPYAGFLIKLVKWGLGQRDLRRVKGLFKDLAEHLEMNSAEEAAEYLAEEMQHEWAQEGVVRGLRAIMDAIDDDARRCIAALVAQYMTRKKLPDLAYKRIASILADSDGKRCRELESLLRALPSDAGEGGWVSMRKASTDSTGEYHVWFGLSSDQSKEVPEYSARLPLGIINALESVLVQSQLGYLETGALAGSRGNPHFSPDSIATLLMLHRCLVAGLGSTTESNDA